jgi:hypothetical protein
MNNVLILPQEELGKNFIPPEYLPKGKDEYYLRNKQSGKPKSGWRQLHSDELEILTKNNNTASNWDEILVTDPFDPGQIKNSKFYGLVRIGCVRNIILQHNDLRISAGITNSMIVSCDIGNDVAIHDVHYLGHYIVGNQSIFLNIQEMSSTDHAKFGNGILKEGEPEDTRIWLHLMNETGCRKVMPFDGMISADAYLWAKYIDDIPLQKNLKNITQNSMDQQRGYYGTTGNNCVIKNCSTIKDVKIGPYCYIKGANKLKNITINSSEEETTQIGEGVELVNGIIGYGCYVSYGCIAVRFIIGDNSNLKYGARLLNSFIGDNSTISCCEILNNLIFPAHEQHHNNSFLVAACIMGQSNIAAGATLGSNHNSRSNDNEIQAGRGFWPGLCTSIKHSCRFSSFTLLTKADYPSEMDIPFPFALLSNNSSKDQLEVMPAFWWMYNMYALARNFWKYKERDKRVNKKQHIEFEAYAPDSIEEIIHAQKLLEIWTAKAYFRKNSENIEEKSQEVLIKTGRSLLNGKAEEMAELEVLGEKMENSKRKVLILKPHKAYQAYQDILIHYAMSNLTEYMETHPDATFFSMAKDLKGRREQEWVNLGGQLMRQKDLDNLRSNIGSGKIKSWEKIHQVYDKLWDRYPKDKQKHAWALLCEIYETENLSETQWLSALDKSLKIKDYICNQVYISRKKDYDNTFHRSTFRNENEMTAAIGTIDDNSFILQVRNETEAYKTKVEDIKNRK